MLTGCCVGDCKHPIAFTVYHPMCLQDRAHTIFGHLLGLGKSRCSIEPTKLQKHVNFCLDQQGKVWGCAQLLLWTHSCPADAA